jgi:hypothetical protein
MRVILDTNVLVAALITRGTPPDQLYEAGRMVNDLKRLAEVAGKLPTVEVSPDPYDNFLLAMAEAAQADILVSGDKRDLLALGHHHATRILTARTALDQLGA